MVGSDQDGDSGHDEKRLNSGCVFKVQLTGFPDALDMQRERKEGFCMTLWSQATVFVSF